MKIGIISLLILLTFTFFCCSTDTIVPPDEELPDTTSQNFTFETYEFGDGFSSSYFNDVWIFDENNIWAVGYISPADTVVDGVHIINPNIIKWDGESWKLQPFSGTSSGIEGIWAYDTSLIYFASGIVIKYSNGIYENIIVQGNWTQGQSINRLWGSSENNIYGVGPFGTIVHYDGVNWKKIEFDRQWYFYEITGDKNGGTGYAVARNENNNSIIVELKNSISNIIYNNSDNDLHIDSWTLNFENGKIYLADTKIWTFNPSSKGIEMLYNLPIGVGILTMSSYNKNDLYFYGSQYQSTNKLIHFNGSSYKVYEIPFRSNSYGGLYAIKNLAVYAGYSNHKAYLIKIIRR